MNWLGPLGGGSGLAGEGGSDLYGGEGAAPELEGDPCAGLQPLPQGVSCHPPMQSTATLPYISLVGCHPPRQITATLPNISQFSCCHAPIRSTCQCHPPIQITATLHTNDCVTTTLTYKAHSLPIRITDVALYQCSSFSHAEDRSFFFPIQMTDTASSPYKWLTQLLLACK